MLVYSDELASLETKYSVMLDILTEELEPKQVNQQYQDKLTILMLLSCFDYSSVLIKYLVKIGADVNLTDQEGSTALIYAAYHMNFPTVNILVNNNANVNWVNNDRMTALETLIERCKELRVYSLEHALSTLHALKSSQLIVLSRACFQSSIRDDHILNSSKQSKYRLKLTDCLIRLGADVNYIIDGMSMLATAATKVDFEMCDLLLKKGANPGGIFQQLIQVEEGSRSMPEVLRMWKIMSNDYPEPILFGETEDTYSHNDITLLTDMRTLLSPFMQYIVHTYNNILKQSKQIVFELLLLKNRIASSNVSIPLLPIELWYIIASFSIIQYTIYPGSKTLIFSPTKTNHFHLINTRTIHPVIAGNIRIKLEPKDYNASIKSISSTLLNFISP